MGVYIKGMDMPKSCPCELLGIGYDLYCSFAGGIPARVKEYYECCQNGTRPSWCPLIPVPDHGRLIDANKLKEANEKRFRELHHPSNNPQDKTAEFVSYANTWANLGVDDASTIIPADPAEEGE